MRNLKEKMSFSIKVFICYSFIFMLYCTVHAQKRQSYSGDYRRLGEEEKEGKVEMNYIIVNGDTVKDGNFRFLTKPVEDGDKLRGYSFFGNYKRGKKNGDWRYDFRTLEKSDKYFIEGRKIAYEGTGEEFQVSGRFNDGVANGNWQIFSYKIIEGEVADTLFTSNVVYQNGQMAGGFSGKNKQIAVEGAFNENGFVDGKWSVVHQNKNPKIEEIRIYQTGVFKNHFFLFDQDTVHISHLGLDETPEDEGEVWETLEVSEKYFRIIKNTNLGIDPDKPLNVAVEDGELYRFSRKTNDFLLESIFSYGRHEEKEIWQKVDGSETLHYAKIRVRKFPYEESEQEQLEDALDKMDKIKETLADFFDDAQIDVSRHSYEEIMVNYEVMKIYQERSKALSEVVEIFADPSFEYVNRKEIFPYIAPEIKYPDKVTYEFKDEEKETEFDFPDPIDEEEALLKYLYYHLSSIDKDLEKITKEVDEIVERYRKRSKLKEKEERLVSKRDSLFGLYQKEYEDKEKYFNEYHAILKDSIVEYGSKLFKQYAKASFEDKIDTVDYMMTCFEEMLKTYDILAEIPDKLEEIDEDYMRTIWSPFTMSEMDERVKERVYNAFENEVIPVLKKELNRSYSSCEDFYQRAKNFDKTFKRMAKLRTEDTKEMERNLRRVKDVREINRIMELNLNLD